MLTFVIVLAFAWEVGVHTTAQVTDQFQRQVANDAAQAQQDIGPLQYDRRTGTLDCGDTLVDIVRSDAQIRIFDANNGRLLCTQEGMLKPGRRLPAGLPPFPMPVVGSGAFDELGYRVVVTPLARKAVTPRGHYLLLYAEPLSELEQTLARIHLFLLLGVLGGTVLALLAGLATARRAVRPIVELTEAAREIERTRDPSRHIPMPEAEDEIAELARTLEGMLAALDAARRETEATLQRQREFVADASHELRTPLTSVLANLELLADELDGEQAESAKAALRSARRMRRLVADLLLLARADSGRERRMRPCDLSEVLLDAAAELGPVADDHDVVIDAQLAPVHGARDDLHRLVLNLLENAVRHTPPGTQVRAHTGVQDTRAVVVVEDDGPGIPPALAGRVFERFVRGGGDGGRGSGLGLAIVRAVTESHGGTVALEPVRPEDPERPGTRFVVELPLAAGPQLEAQGAGLLLEPQTSTTTGSTIGRRRSRS